MPYDMLPTFFAPVRKAGRGTRPADMEGKRVRTSHRDAESVQSVEALRRRAEALEEPSAGAFGHADPAGELGTGDLRFGRCQALRSSFELCRAGPGAKSSVSVLM